jgi:RimJ/RimL family protein N-acetyltransferase
MWSDPNVTRMISGTPSTESQTWLRLLAYTGHWQLRNFGYWVIEERDSGAFVGEAGFADFKRDIGPAMRDVPELGFALATRFHGKGYATEAVGAVVSWGDANLPYDRTVCLINAQNLPSLRIAEKHGYRPFDRTTFNQREVVLLDRTRQRDK